MDTKFLSEFIQNLLTGHVCRPTGINFLVEIITIVLIQNVNYSDQNFKYFSYKEMHGNNYFYYISDVSGENTVTLHSSVA